LPTSVCASTTQSILDIQKLAVQRIMQNTLFVHQFELFLPTIKRRCRINVAVIDLFLSAIASKSWSVLVIEKVAVQRLMKKHIIRASIRTISADDKKAMQNQCG